MGETALDLEFGEEAGIVLVFQTLGRTIEGGRERAWKAVKMIPQLTPIVRLPR